MPIPELMAGWQRFRGGRFREQRELIDRITREGQQPRVLMIACCDSRVDPAILFDCDPGDIFVVRNVANLVPPYEETGRYHGTSAALEFAVVVLGVQHVVVLGHSQCGGIGALMRGDGETTPPMRFLPLWVALGQEARTVALAASGLEPAARVDLCSRLAIRLSLRNLMTFRGVRDRVEKGRLQLHGWFVDVRQGELSMLDEAVGRFVPLGCGAPGGPGDRGVGGDAAPQAAGS
ncbi:MAG: carbonic anhydrase [Planctomycetes bacterium]|nr:carbonic anhydrase [Planctomycetota bacterium]